MFTYSDGSCETDSGVIRKHYSYTHQSIKTVSDLAATIRNGPYAWPGGYQMFFITDDGAALSFETAKNEFCQIARSIKDNLSDGWRIVATDINYEDPNLFDSHSGERIESAWAETD